MKTFLRDFTVEWNQQVQTGGRALVLWFPLNAILILGRWYHGCQVKIAGASHLGNMSFFYTLRRFLGECSQGLDRNIKGKSLGLLNGGLSGYT
jgi:hypothetical protein